jgi:hypothetical protein
MLDCTLAPRGLHMLPLATILSPLCMLAKANCFRNYFYLHQSWDTRNTMPFASTRAH